MSAEIVDGLAICEWWGCKKGINGKARKFKQNPAKKDHRYCCSSCRVAAWNFKNAGAGAIAKINERLTALEQYVREREGQ